ncbi:MAG: hypothetical protein G01um101431_281 [Parcubacteria group bacterium Gr01-1014_31]|nr:MAG: hypothetical protein G01um101431_281 [Parcubacteria group bacterium Gr01-1014_31]
MLEHLFGSTTRVKLLQRFLNNPEQPYYLRELARAIHVQLNSVRREVANLESIGIISPMLSPSVLPGSKEAAKPARKVRVRKQLKKFYLANSSFLLYPELKALLVKAQLLVEQKLIERIKNIASVQLLVLTGMFVGLEGFSTDLLLVGTVNRKRLARLMGQFERELDHPINYTVMTVAEFRYRHNITDKFLYTILENKKIVVIDRLRHGIR